VELHETDGHFDILGFCAVDATTAH